MNSSQSLFILGLIVLIVSSGCGKSEKSDEKNSAPNNKPSTNSVPEVKLNTKNLAVDRSKSFPVFKLGQPFGFTSKVLLQFEVDELKAHKSLGRELMIIPMENSVEIREEWPLEGPTPVSGDSIGDIALSRPDVDTAIIRCKNYSKLNERPDVAFMLRVIYSDSVRPARTTLLVLEIPLAK